jgi:hypothetical protein
MGSIPDEGLVVVGNCGICNLELGSGMREEEYMWVVATMVELEFTSGSVSINV